MWNFPSGWVGKHGGLGPRTNQIMASKQERKSTYVSKMFTILYQTWNYVWLPYP